MSSNPHPPIRITDNLYQLGIQRFPVYLSMGEIGMIIEGGTGATSGIVVDQIDQLGIDPQKIKYIVLTHTHADHIGAVPRLGQLWPHVQILASSVAAESFKSERVVAEFLPTDKIIAKILLEWGVIEEMAPALDEYNFHVDRVLNEGDRISLGNGINWHVYETPGHSPCHISLFEEKEQSLAIGDMTGYHDPQRDIIWPNYFHSIDEYCESIRKVIDVPAQRGLLSHNGVLEGNIRLYFEKAMAATEAYHLELLKRLSKGEEPEKIWREKADWVYSFAPITSLNAIVFLCKLLQKQSLRHIWSGLFALPQDKAA